MFGMSEFESNYTEIQVTVYVEKPELLQEEKETNDKSDKKCLYGYRDFKERYMSSLGQDMKTKRTERKRCPKILQSLCKSPVVWNMKDSEELNGLGLNVKCKTDLQMRENEHVETKSIPGLCILLNNVENCCDERHSDLCPKTSSTVACNKDAKTDNIEAQPLPDEKTHQIQNVIHEILKHNDIKSIYGQKGEMVYNSEIKYNKPLIQCEVKEADNKDSEHYMVEKSLSSGNKIGQKHLDKGTDDPKLVLKFQSDRYIKDSDKCDTCTITLKDEISLKEDSNTVSAMGEKRSTLKMQHSNDINILRKECFDKTTEHASLQYHFNDVSKTFDDRIEKLCFEECNGKDDGKECNSNDQIQNERNHNNGINSIGLPKSAGCVQDSKNINDKKDYPVSEIDASDLYFYGNVGLNDPDKRSDDYFKYNAVSGGGNIRYCRYKHAYNDGYNPYFFPNFQFFTKPYMYNKRFPEQQSGQYSQFSARKRQRVNFPKYQMNTNHKSNPSMINVFRGNRFERHSARWYDRPQNFETKETMYWISRSFDAIKNCAYEHFSKFIDEKVKPQRISHERFDDNLKRTLRRNMSRYFFEATRSDPRFVSPRIMIDCIIDTIKNPHNVIKGERQCRQFEQVIGYMDKNSLSYWCEIVFHGGQFVVVRPLTNSL